MTILDGITGHEFEETMGDVFRNIGYENVHVSQKSGDEGRDILMEEVVNGQRRAVVVECKHQQRVGRPVIQKLHSAVTTYDFTGPKRGLLVTTGTVTDQAREYAKKIREQGDGTLIEIIDGHELREQADGAGLDLYNGRVEIICDQTLSPIDPAGDVTTPVREAFSSIRNFDATTLSKITSSVTFNPVVKITAQTSAIFETSVGEIHRVSERDSFLFRADQPQPTLAEGPMQTFAADHFSGTATTNIDDPVITESFETTLATRFQKTKTEYTDWATDHLQQKYTETVEYTGDNNVTYEKECIPSDSDITVNSVTPVYVPEVSSQTELQDYSYTLSYYAAGAQREITDDSIRRCVHCGKDRWWSRSFTYCDNCGSINCRYHIKTERIEGEPICSGCAITERFAFRKKYFYTEENRNQFREEYDQMSLHEKALENKPAIVSAMLVFLFVLTLFV